MRPGEIVDDRFEIEQLAGQGGMGVVYRARERQSGEVVALKVLRVASGPEAERFSREAEVLAELRHPGIVRCVGHGRTGDGAPYLAMEWLDGQGLDAVIRGRRLPVGDALLLVRRVAEALSVAHRRGVIHRDLKPSNLFLPGGVIADVKLIDFGIARFLTHGARAITVTGAMLGTPGYMAPEQARGLPSVDARADVYSLGVVLFRCLTGKTPFKSDDMVTVLVKLVLEEAPRLRDLAPEAPAALDHLVARMLAKAPADRPADAGALLSELDAITHEDGEALHRSNADEAVTVETTPARSTLTIEEQRVLCVLLAVAAGTAEAGSPFEAEPNEEALRATADRYGGKLDILADGTLLVTVSGAGSASDHAIAVARCALALRLLLPGAAFTAAAGRGVASRRVPVGEVIDRGVRMLARGTEAAIRIDDELARLLDARFEVSVGPLGPVLVRERSAEEPVRTLLGKPTSCVGRERDLALLETTIAHCAFEPEAAIVLVTAPPGAGKSRLRYELGRRLAERASGARERAWEVWIARGDPTSAGAPFDMIAQMVRRAAGVLPGEPLAEQHAKIRARVLRHLPAADVARVTEFLGELVGAPFPAEESVQIRAARQDPMLMGDQMRRAFLDLLAAECALGPVMLVLEDLHWGDLPTVTLVDSAVRRLQDHPLLVLALARPEVFKLFPDLWSERGVQLLALRPLTPKGSERLVREAIGDQVDADTVARIVERAAGNPFYLEELIRAVAEGKGESLPMTVLAMVEARLAALDAEQRRLLRAASVFGQVFWRGGVRVLAGAGADVDARLAALVEREAITRRMESRFPGEQEYVFRHALLRDSAYATLTDADRALGHRLAGQWLEEAGVSEAMVLAEHFERGEDPARAAAHFLKAAEQALQGNDIEAAIARAERGVRCGVSGEDLGALRLLQTEAELWRGESAAGLAWAREAMSLLPHGSERWCLAAGRAAAAAGRLADHEALGALAVALGSLEGSVGSGSDAAPYAVACARTAMSLLLVGGRTHAEPLILALDRLGDAIGSRDPIAWAWIDRVFAVRDYFAEDIGAYLHRSRAVAESFAAGGDVRSATLQQINVGYGQMTVGAYADAERTLREVAEAAERLGLRIVTATALHNWGMALCQLGALDEAKRIESAAVEACQAQGDRRLEGGSRMYLAAILQRSGDVEGAEREAQAAVELLAGIGPVRAQALATLSAVKLVQGDTDAALDAAREAMVLLEHGGAESGEGLVRLAYAEALVVAGDTMTARAALEKARDRLLARAANIRDEALRESFLHRVPENARTLDLAGPGPSSPATNRTQ